MAYLLYSALTREGQRVRRLGQYEGLEDLDKELAQHGEQLVDYHLLADSIGQAMEYLRGKPKPLEIAEFCMTLSYYVSGGVDLQGALGDAAETTRSPSMRSAIIEIRRRLQSGYSLSASMEMTGRFPEVVISMTRIGEEAGNLDRMLRDAAQHLERVVAIKSAAKRAMVYPIFTFLVVSAAAAFWMIVVVPQIVELFESMQVELAPETLALIAISDFFEEYWVWMLVALVAIPFVWMLARRNERFRLLSDKALWHMPLVGRIISGSQLAFYYQYLALMYGAGVVITTALATLQKTVSNTYFASQVSTILQDLRSGLPLGMAFKQSEVFPVLDQRMISIGEQTGNLDEQLQRLADMHFRKVEALVELLPKYLEPIMLIIMGTLFAFFIIALMGPLYDMVTRLGGA